MTRIALLCTLVLAEALSAQQPAKAAKASFGTRNLPAGMLDDFKRIDQSVQDKRDEATKARKEQETAERAHRDAKWNRDAADVEARNLRREVNQALGARNRSGSREAHEVLDYIRQIERDHQAKVNKAVQAEVDAWNRVDAARNKANKAKADLATAETAAIIAKAIARASVTNPSLAPGAAQAVVDAKKATGLAPSQSASGPKPANQLENDHQSGGRRGDRVETGGSTGNATGNGNGTGGTTGDRQRERQRETNATQRGPGPAVAHP